MDSGNSGSMSSSGGDDQDLDIVSRPESVSGFLSSSHPVMQFGGSSDNNPTLFSQYQNHQPNTLFELSSNYLQALSQSQSPNSSNPIFLLNQRSDRLPNSTISTGSDHQQANCTNPVANLPGSSLSAHQAPSVSGTPRGSYSSSKPNSLARNSKRRTRASRRAPTTVLTTDTSNFRAMVQEFTGIPAPPFSGGSSSYARRLDSIFGSGSVYAIRPSAQKVHQTPFLSSSSSLLMSNSVNMVDASNIATSSTSLDMNNFNFPHQGLMGKPLPHQHNMMINMQNPILSPFQSSLPHHHEQQQQQLPPFLSSSVNFGAKPDRDSTTLPLHSLEDQLGMNMSHGYLNTNLGASDRSTMLPLRSDDNHNVRWRDHGLGLGAVSDGRGVAADQNHHLRPNLDHHGIVSSSRSNTRGETTVESWICPSDWSPS